jgi:hypothetical protein
VKIFRCSLFTPPLGYFQQHAHKSQLELSTQPKEFSTQMEL